MKYLTSLSIIILCSITTASSQDLGYKTTDVGGEIQYQPDGLLLHLHLAFNAKTHHAVIFRAGYNKINTGSPTHYSEVGNGWGGSLGYRYYFDPVPRKFFGGFRIDGYKMTVHWSIPVTESDTKIAFLQPAIETGYTFLINDMFFITPHLSAGYQIKISSKGEAVVYGEGFIPQVGISAGWRF
jgi:hypothetical protein